MGIEETFFYIKHVTPKISCHDTSFYLFSARSTLGRQPQDSEGSEGEDPEVVEVFQFGTSAEVAQKAEAMASTFTKYL